jgi:hypothetical protein
MEEQRIRKNNTCCEECESLIKAQNCDSILQMLQRQCSSLNDEEVALNRLMEKKD